MSQQLDMEDVENETYAVKFGWKQNKDGFWGHPEEDQIYVGAPDFTGSLDAIVREVERNGLGWSVGIKDGEPWAMLAEQDGSVRLRPARTSPLALCEAYEAYLET